MGKKRGGEKKYVASTFAISFVISVLCPRLKGTRGGGGDSNIVTEVEGERRGSREVEVEREGEKAWGELIKTPRNAFTREREEEGGGDGGGEEKKEQH